jgi:predicted amidohydrolase YtcJ
VETLRRGLEARPAWLDRRPGAKHAIGDAAVGIELDAFERSGASGSIEHAQLAAPPDVAKLAVLGAAASVQPAHPAGAGPR